jgi:AraC-like DNA-binding protein
VNSARPVILPDDYRAHGLPPDLGALHPDFRPLAARLARALSARTSDQQSAAAAAGLYAGIETRTDPAVYRWDGLRRSGSRRVPSVLFQYTLAGQGAYEDASGKHPVTPGRAFLAVIPSAHLYYLPAGKTWTFFWIIIHHPYAVERLARAVGGVGRLLSATPASPVVQSATDLAEAAARGGFSDPFDLESAVFRWMLELQRHFHERSVSATERDHLLGDTRRYVLEHLARRVDTAELARRQGMTRSHFAHHFKHATGRAPADYVTEVRLAEAARLLSTTDHTLKQLAQACGFADANHLCKAFRRKYHISPGVYRKQAQ